MSPAYNSDAHIILPDNNRQLILVHSNRTLKAFQEGQTKECKAFGLVFGTVSNQVITVMKCFPLDNNVRSQPPYKEYIDKIMEEHAVPSQTPLDKRGWVADPAELFTRIKESRNSGFVLLGTYHMHRLGWSHDPVRDTPTKLDGVLAKDSELLMFIVSMVQPTKPIIRAFYEGIKEKEIPIQ